MNIITMLHGTYRILQILWPTYDNYGLFLPSMLGPSIDIAHDWIGQVDSKRRQCKTQHLGLGGRRLFLA